MTTAEVLELVAAERYWQDSTHGAPRDFPDGTGGGAALLDLQFAREEYDRAHAAGEMTWRHILEEEWCEAMAETDPEKLETELVQIAAVACAWVEALRRRNAAKETA